jgi:hypothetical protein
MFGLEMCVLFANLPRAAATPMGIFSRFVSPKRTASSAGSSATPKASNVQARQARRFAAVEIVPARGACCKAVKALSGQRFLYGKAPLVPLPDCDQSECKCSYQRLDERRTDLRRDTDLGVGTLRIHYPSSRRSGPPGRRSTDKAR